ncbi:transposable element Tcb2 transposase [Trichonephila clavipes]|nr:transposable element Tcb2 transposase [Trichonephila clavipes]
MGSEISSAEQNGVLKWKIVNPDYPNQDNGTKILSYCIVIGPEQVSKFSNYSNLLNRVKIEFKDSVTLTCRFHNWCDGVWGIIACNARSLLVLIHGTRTAQPYVRNILQSHVLPLMQRLPGACFQQDNARPYTAKVSQDYLRFVTIFPWLVLSPDLSPIEHIWIHLGLRVGHPTSLNELKTTRQCYSKYGTKCLKTSYINCMPQCPIV